MNMKLLTGTFLNRKPSARRCGSLVAACLWLLCANAFAASAPSPFAAEYVARYGGFKASAERSLLLLDDGVLQMETSLALKLLGKTISRIHETSSLAVDADSGEIRPQEYRFDQTGIGSRSRSVVFDWDNATALAQSGRDESLIALDGVAMDNLSGYLAVREQLLDGRQDISFQGVDKGELQDFHYNVIGEEQVETAAGTFRTLKLERLRDAQSRRTTEIWLALDWDYLLVKLVQKEPGSNTISLELTEAAVDGQPVLGVNEG